jgi:flagellar biogenesis protein FliO
MSNKAEGLVTFSLASALVVCLALGGVGHARAGEAVSDRVVDSLLLRGEKAPQLPSRGNSKTAGSLPLTTEGPKTPAKESLFKMGKLKGLGVVGLIVSGVALLIFGAWRNGWRLRPAGSLGPPIRLVSTKPLGDKKAIAVVDVEGQRLVVGMTSHQVTLLTTLPAQTEESEEYIIEEQQEQELPREPRWAQPPVNYDFGKKSYPDIQGIFTAMRG